MHELNESNEIAPGRIHWAERHRQHVAELRQLISGSDLNDAQRRDATDDMMWHIQQAARLDTPPTN